MVEHRRVHVTEPSDAGVLTSGLADELTVDVMPVFYGAGRRLFDDPDLAHVQIEKIDVQEVTECGMRTMMRFRVK